MQAPAFWQGLNCLGTSPPTLWMNLAWEMTGHWMVSFKIVKILRWTSVDHESVSRCRRVPAYPGARVEWFRYPGLSGFLDSLDCFLGNARQVSFLRLSPRMQLINFESSRIGLCWNVLGRDAGYGRNGAVFDRLQLLTDRDPLRKSVGCGLNLSSDGCSSPRY